MGRIIVIGAGLLGLTSAYYLAERGHAVTVLERRKGPGLETSFANGGLLTPSMSDPWNAPGVHRNLLKWLGRDDAPMLLRLRAIPSLAVWGLGFLRNSAPSRFGRNMLANHALAVYSRAAMRGLRRDGIGNGDPIKPGTMKVFRDMRAFDHAAALTEILESHGLRCERLDATGVVKAEPHLAAIKSQITGGLLYPDDQSGDAFQFCVALAETLRGRGVEMRYNADVQAIAIAGGAVSGVQLPGEHIAAEQLVIAAGSYSPRLARAARIRVPVKPVKGYSLTTDTLTDMPQLPVVDDSLHAAVTPLGHRLRIVGTAEFAGFDVSRPAGRVDNLLALFAQIYPHLHRNTAREQFEAWAGLRPVSADGVPVIGATGVRGLYLNTGHGHLGWTLAAGSGRLLADLVDGRIPEINGAPYSPARFGG